MNSKRLYLALCGLVGLLMIGLVAGTYGANSLLTSRANTLTGLKAKSQALDQEQTILTQAKKQVQKYSDLNKIAHAVVPQDKNQAEAVREIVNIAAAHGVSLASVTVFPASTLGALVGGSTAATPSASTSRSPAASSTNSKAGALSQLQPVKNISGVYLLQIIVTGDPLNTVPYSQFISFLSDLEHDRRTAQVSTLTLQPDSHNRNNLSFSLTLNEYIKP